MRLYYWKSDHGNFGDELNPWLWPRIFGENLFNNQGPVFIGIGTVLDDRFAQENRKVVFGSGYGYRKLPTLDEKWNILFVRGPLTASLLQLPDYYAITDPSLLVRNFTPEAPKKIYSLSLMLHHDSLILKQSETAELCKEIGIHFIDPRWPVEKVIEHIRSSRLLFSEALHGAAIADAFRVPWIPIVWHTQILRFKWWDWCSSLNMLYNPLTTQDSADLLNSSPKEFPKDSRPLLESLHLLAKNREGVLSDVNRQNILEERLFERVEKLKSLLSSG